MLPGHHGAGLTDVTKTHFTLMVLLEGHQGGGLYFDGIDVVDKAPATSLLVMEPAGRVTSVLVMSPNASNNQGFSTRMSNIAVSKGVTMGSATAIVNEVEKRAGEIISKAAQPITKAEAYARIFQADPALYAKYRGAQQVEVGNQVVLTKADGTPTPTFGAALMARQLDGLDDLTGALVSTLQGIVSSEASDQDKGPRVQQALDDFASAVRQAFTQAGIAVPVAKQALLPPRLEAELLLTLMKVAPRDPTGSGAATLAKALQQLRQGLGS
jgi:hypothetical protein